MEQIFARSTSSNSLISCQNRIMISSSLISEYWLIWLIFEQRRISENPLKYNGSYSATARTRAVWRRLSSHKDSQYFFFWQTDQLNSRLTMQPLKTLNRLKLIDLLGNSLQIYECYWSFHKKTWESFVFRNRCDWTIFFQVPRFE